MLLEALEDYEKKQEAVYDPVSFGDIGTYLQNKRAKLQRQAEAVQAESDTLRGCAIYVNGRTDPPYAELRRLILLHGGRFVPYLDAKRDVTHIVTTDLTAPEAPRVSDTACRAPGVGRRQLPPACEAAMRGVRTRYPRYDHGVLRA